jgi:hypothetical protein
VRRRFAPHQLRHAHAVELAPGGGAGEHHPTPVGAYRSRDDLDVSARDRSQRDRRRGPLPTTPDDARQRSTGPMSNRAPRADRRGARSPRLLRSDRQQEQPPDEPAGQAANQPSRPQRRRPLPSRESASRAHDAIRMKAEAGWRSAAYGREREALAVPAPADAPPLGRKRAPQR